MHHRVDVDGRAVLFQRGDHVGQYALRNLSAGGAFIAGERHLRAGHLVHVLMELASCDHDQPLSLTGSIHRVREADNGVSVALRFPALSADQEDAIQNAVLQSLLRRETQTTRLPLLVFEPRLRVRKEIEAEIRSFGLSVTGVDSLDDAVQELEGEDVEYAGIIIHSVTHDRESMDVVEFFTRKEGLRTIILPEPDGELSEDAKRLASLPHVSVPRIWSRSELRRALGGPS